MSAELEEVTLKEALDSLEAAYVLGGVEAAREVMRVLPVLHSHNLPVHKEWSPDFVRAIVISEIQAFIGAVVRERVADFASADTRTSKAARALVEEMIAAKYGAIVQTIPGLSLVGMTVRYNPTLCPTLWRTR